MNQYNENNEKTGYWEEYHSNGELYYKGNFINGKRSGYWEQYYYNDKFLYKKFFI